MKKIFITLAILLSLSSTFKIAAAAPGTSYDLKYTGLVQCDGAPDPQEPLRNNRCNFAQLMNMINYIIKWIFALTIPIFIILLAYAGILYMGPPNSGRRSQAKSMLWAAIVGFVIMLSAWFIVTTLLNWLISKNFKGADSLIEVKK